MRLYYLGSTAEFARAVREDWYTEWSIGFGRGVLLSAERPVMEPDPVVVLDIPDTDVEPYARGSAWPGEYLVPAPVVTAHNPAPKLTFD